MDQDNLFFVQKVEKYMNFIGEELNVLKKYPDEKKREFLNSFMTFYEHYLSIKSKWQYDEVIIPENLHNKIVANLKKARAMVYRQEDYILDMKVGLVNFEDNLTEIYYYMYELKAKEGKINEEIKSALRRKCIIFFQNLDELILQYRSFFKEQSLSEVLLRRDGLLKLLKLDFDIIVEEEKDLGSINITVVDDDMILDMYEKIKHMRKSKAKTKEQEKFKRLCEIYGK